MKNRIPFLFLFLLLKGCASPFMLGYRPTKAIVQIKSTDRQHNHIKTLSITKVNNKRMTFNGLIYYPYFGTFDTTDKGGIRFQNDTIYYVDNEFLAQGESVLFIFKKGAEWDTQIVPRPYAGSSCKIYRKEYNLVYRDTLYYLSIKQNYQRVSDMFYIDSCAISRKYGVVINYGYDGDTITISYPPPNMVQKIKNRCKDIFR